MMHTIRSKQVYVVLMWGISVQKKLPEIQNLIYIITCKLSFAIKAVEKIVKNPYHVTNLDKEGGFFLTLEE